MSDPRLTPANGRVAAAYLKGHIAADRFVDGTVKTVTVPVIDLRPAPDAMRVRQLLLGAQVKVFEERGGWAFVQAVDGYVGYVPLSALGNASDPTHFVATPATHAYAQESMKSADLMYLSFGSRLRVVDERKSFFETEQGYIPKKHLRPLAQPFTDPATVAQMHFGVPYLWGGNSIGGLDCSGLIAASLMACRISCPADSDLQCGGLGAHLADDAPLQRGDLMFWKGHVGMMVDAETMIHANAHHMSTAYEPITNAILRIKAQGDGDVIARKRLAL
jgi:cell wall-associated NlpC family hydrolase